MVATSKTGEICDLQEADQFQAGKSQFECGFFAVAMCRSMAEVGKPPTLTMQQVINDAEAWYAQYDGSNAGWNTAGMSLQQLYDLLHQVGLHYQETALDISIIKKWLAVGYPVVVAIAETSVVDMALGRNPYPWRVAGNHIIVITGVASDGNVLVRDSANCTNLYDPRSLRPGPRKYEASRLALVSATVVVPPWLPRPTSNMPPVHPPVVNPPPVVKPPVVKPPVSLWVSSWQELAAFKEWNSTAHLFAEGKPPDYGTAIAREWQARYRQGHFDGPPFSVEYDATDWQGKPIRVQQFARRRYEAGKDGIKQY